MAKKRQAAKKQPAGTRERLDAGTDVLFAKRDRRGRWTEMDDVGRSSAQIVAPRPNGRLGLGTATKGDLL